MEDDRQLKQIEMAKDGRWLIPVEQRPSGWQAMGLKEQEDTTTVVVLEAPGPTAPVTSVIANTSAELPGLQAPLIPWAQKKLGEARAEYAELDESIQHAKKRKWKFTSMVNARGNALSRVDFYEKIVSALEDGYMIFPPVPNAAVFAIRTEHTHQSEWRHTRNHEYPAKTETAEGLPAGEGEYANPYVRWIHWGDKDIGGGNVDREWRSSDLGDPVFPLKMAKPQIVEAVNAAMEKKLFDEIRMFPMEVISAPAPRLRAGAMADPCILGSIFDRRNKKRHFFLISWLITESDI